MPAVDYPSRTPVRTPDPLNESRRRALNRLGETLNAMGLGAIGDIGSNAFTTVEKITWETTTDWDSAASESGVVHSDYAGGDRTSERVRIGYEPEDPGGTNLRAYYPSDDDGGSTINDVTGNGYDGTYTGPSLGNTGVYNSTAPTYDGTDDYADLPSGVTVTGSTNRTISVWYSSTDDSTDGGLFQFGSGGTDGEDYSLRSYSSNTDTWRIQYWGSPDTDVTLSGSFDGNLHHFVLRTDASNGETWLYYDGSLVSNHTHSPLSTATGYSRIAFWEDAYFPGTVDELQVYDRLLTDSEAKALYRGGRTNTLTGATKTLSTASTPDFVDLNYSLNGETARLVAIGSPGTADEETQSVTLDGATGYTLSWTNSHTDFRVRLELETATPTATPVINSVTLQA